MDKRELNNETPLVEVKDLQKFFIIPQKGELHAVDGVNFKIYPGQTLGLVGESGCGKSTVGNVVMRLLPRTGGQILFNGEPVPEKINRKSYLEYSQKMQIIFQDPYSSLNPRKTIRAILEEPFVVHGLAKDKQQLEEKLKQLCKDVDLSEDILNRYPHELDGGTRQVVGIARALSLDPEFVICDEPVSSLDVSVQAKIINLLKNLQKKKNLSYLFISHDLSVVKHISDQIAVMYLGQIIEIADKNTLFENTLHPYSIALLSAVPKMSVDKKVNRIVLKGDVPSPMNPKPGCRFASRCWMAKPECKDLNTTLIEAEPGHFVACPYFAESRTLAEFANKTSLD